MTTKVTLPPSSPTASPRNTLHKKFVEDLQKHGIKFYGRHSVKHLESVCSQLEALAQPTQKINKFNTKDNVCAFLEKVNNQFDSSKDLVKLLAKKRFSILDITTIPEQKNSQSTTTTTTTHKITTISSLTLKKLLESKFPNQFPNLQNFCASNEYSSDEEQDSDEQLTSSPLDYNSSSLPTTAVPTHTPYATSTTPVVSITSSSATDPHTAKQPLTPAAQQPDSKLLQQQIAATTTSSPQQITSTPPSAQQQATLSSSSPAPTGSTASSSSSPTREVISQSKALSSTKKILITVGVVAICVTIVGFIGILVYSRYKKKLVKTILLILLPQKLHDFMNAFRNFFAKKAPIKK